MPMVGLAQYSRVARLEPSNSFSSDGTPPGTPPPGATAPPYAYGAPGYGVPYAYYGPPYAPPPYGYAAPYFRRRGSSDSGQRILMISSS